MNVCRNYNLFYPDNPQQISSKFLYDYDPIGQLNRLFPEEKTKDIIETVDIEFNVYRSTIKKSYKNVMYEAVSQDWPSIEEAEREVVLRFLNKIGINIKDNFLKSSIKKKDEPILVASESYDIQEILFKKSDYLDNIKVKSSPEPGGTIIEYAERKIEKNPLFVLFAVSSWRKEIEISHWIAEPPGIKSRFILMNLKLKNQTFFEFGFYFFGEI